MGKTQELGAFRMRARGARGGPGRPGARWATRGRSGRLRRIVAAASRLARPPGPKQGRAGWSGRAGFVDGEAHGRLTLHRSLWISSILVVPWHFGVFSTSFFPVFSRTIFKLQRLADWIVFLISLAVLSPRLPILGVQALRRGWPGGLRLLWASCREAGRDCRCY